MEEELIIPEQVSEKKTEKLIEEQIPEAKPVMMSEQISEEKTDKIAEEQMPEEEDVEQQEDAILVDLLQLSRKELLEKLTDIYQKKLFKEKKTLLNNIRSEYRKLQDKHEKELADAFVPTAENPEFIYVHDTIDLKFSELQSSIR
ncbi:MAG: hypothetical protein LBC89_00675, partial [Bacteroidales bacterium]|nr:hypothetical protein [Bacteroidales bacterium]